MYKFKQNIDFERNVVANFRFQNEIAFPSAGAGIDKGLVFFHSALNTFYGWDGTSWLNLGNISGSYVLPPATTLVLGGVKIDGTTITIDGDGVISSAAGGTGLEAITETGTGWRLVGMNAANYGPIGTGSIDFGQNTTTSSVFGGKGLYGLNYGEDNTQAASMYYQFTGGADNITSNHYAIAWGFSNTASNYCSMAFGYDNAVPSPYSMTFGVYNNVQDYYSGAIGLGLDVQSPHSFACGTGNTIYANTSINQANTRLFIVGNSSVNAGTPNIVGTRSDAFLVYWDGRVVAPSLTTSVIDAEATGKVLITREWYEAQPKPYTIYTALISQSGTADPTVTVLENTLGTITWTRTSTGTYTGTLSGATFTNNKTAYFFGNSTQNTIISGARQNDTVFLIVTWRADLAAISDGLMFNTTIEIRVYA